jgi:predicted RNase H-like HicB family nuclease
VTKERQYLLKVEVEPLEDGRYLAVCHDLEGCHAEGDTIAEALENIEDVARIVIELCREKDLPLPPEFKANGEPLVRAELLVRA